MIRLTQAELQEAVTEWCRKRGIPAEASNVTFKSNNGSVETTKDWYHTASVNNVEVPPKDGPYR
jgi:hypothetical protein